jgi:hypothetical protein
VSEQCNFSKPITFVATHDPATDQYDEDFDIQRVTPDEEPEVPRTEENAYLGWRLTSTEWFDEELNNYGTEGFLEACNVLDDVRKHGKIKVTVVLESIHTNNTNREDWDLDFEVKSVEPA